MSIVPTLFTLYAEMMMKEVMENIDDSVKVGSHWLKDVRFADDQGMIAGTEEGLQTIMNSLTTTAKKYDMKIMYRKPRLCWCQQIVTT